MSGTIQQAQAETRTIEEKVITLLQRPDVNKAQAPPLVDEVRKTQSAMELRVRQIETTTKKNVDNLGCDIQD